MHAVCPPPELLTGICDRTACRACQGPFRSVGCGIMVAAMQAFRDPRPDVDAYGPRHGDFARSPSGSVEDGHVCRGDALGGEAADRTARHLETHPRRGGRMGP